MGGFLVFFYLSLQQVLNFNSEVDNGEAFLVKLGVLVCFQVRQRNLRNLVVIVILLFFTGMHAFVCVLPHILLQ